MPSFTDTLGREWSLTLDLDLHEQVKQQCGILLVSLGDNDHELLLRLSSDLSLLCDVLVMLCQEQFEKNGIVADDKLSAERKFGKGLSGDVLENATKALVDAVIDFFPNRAQREGLKELTAKAYQTMEILNERSMLEIRNLDPASLAQKFIDSSGSALESPAVATANEG